MTSGIEGRISDKEYWFKEHQGWLHLLEITIEPNYAIIEFITAKILISGLIEKADLIKKRYKGNPFPVMILGVGIA